MYIKVGRKHEPNAQYIGRGSPLGNPFVMKDESQRELVCDQYRDWLYGEIAERNPVVIAELERLYNHALSYQTLTLGCFCAPKQCHGEIIRDVLHAYNTFFDWDEVGNEYSHYLKTQMIELNERLEKLSSSIFKAQLATRD
jgi:hypothetical protein